MLMVLDQLNPDETYGSLSELKNEWDHMKEDLTDGNMIYGDNQYIYDTENKILFKANDLVFAVTGE